MFRLSKLTDYAIVLLSYLMRSNQPRTARDLAELAGLPHPTASKVLKMLARADLLVSVRGQRGGYELAMAPREISVMQMISAIEGPLAITECSTHQPNPCELEPSCPVSSNWKKISEKVASALDEMTLADMVEPQFPIDPLTQLPTRRKLDLARS